MGRTTTPRVSGRERDVLLGTLLGDGSIVKGERYAHPRVVIRHSVKQQTYIHWKSQALSALTSDHPLATQGRDGRDGWGGEKIRFQSRALTELDEVYLLVKPHGKKEVRRRWLNQLTPLSLAVWWCDDGSLTSNTRHGVFCTDGFSKKEVEILKRYLHVVWGIDTKLVAITSRPGQYRLHIYSKRMLEKWLRLLLPHVPVQEMLYKFLLLYRDESFQQRWVSEVAALSRFSRSEIERVVARRKAALKHFR